MRLLIIILLVLGCGKKEIEDTNTELQELVNDFYTTGQRLGAVMPELDSIVFKDLEEKRLGHALMPIRQIEINQKYWADLNDRSKKVLIYHELIHAVCFKYGHSEDKTHIMYPYHRMGYINSLTEEQFEAFLKQGIIDYCFGLSWFTKPIEVDVYPPKQKYITDW
jgi:hypothetical protein